MKDFKLAQELILSNGAAVMTQNIKKALKDSPVELARFYSNYGADLLFITDLSYHDDEHEVNINTAREIIANTDVPVILGGNVKRLEDIKKYLYAGASMTFLNMNVEWNRSMIKEAADRFGSDKLAVLAGKVSVQQSMEWKEQGASLIIKSLVEETDKELALPVLYRGTGFQPEQDYHENACGYCYPTKETAEPFYEIKQTLKETNIPVILPPQPAVSFTDFKKDENGLVPVIVQDYQTNEVLMLAYMNEEAFSHTIACGRMTYYSRSRQEQWEKGLTSGHFQYWKELKADCDYDTILAKVYQVGAACHTGAYSCFFNEIAKKDYTEKNPYQVFEKVFSVILDRKEHPKEGSYTNYLFEKGIDKILKKCGEEAAEIIIAAKNQKPEEVTYEISDFLYHMMVLMAEQGISWEDITAELARR